MRYVSTRGQVGKRDFSEVVLSNLAEDGGLYLPEIIPSFSHSEISAMAGLSYSEVAFRLIEPYVNQAMPAEDLRQLIEQSYGTFSHQAVAPLRQADSGLFVLELFHGPTLAFKDIALQLLGRLLDYFLSKKQQKAIILAATSGDTGSAAIEGCRHSPWLDLFVLHPDQKISDMQRRQMTTVLAPNVHNIAIEGDFDQAQAIVKACFRKPDFLPNQHLLAVNSINWARIMAQIVYYFTAAISLGAPYREIIFSVPSGNFGDVFAGYMAREMGLPIERLLIATNANDILHRLVAHNDMRPLPLQSTLAPAMDIVVPSNLERLLFYAYQRNGLEIERLFTAGASAQAISPSALSYIQRIFSSSAHHDAAIIETMSHAFRDYQICLDPHSATAFEAAQDFKAGHHNEHLPIVSLATAHPAKFPHALQKANLKIAELPRALSDLANKPERFERLPAEIEAVQNYISQHYP